MRKQSSSQIWEWVGVHRAEGVWFPSLQHSQVTVTNVPTVASHPGDALWHLLPSSWSRVSASLCPEENTSHPEDLAKILEVPHRIPCVSVTMRSRGARLTLPARSLNLHHILSTGILIKLFQFQCGWLLACH